MKAMILAAGLGTRLGSLTRDRPKALVEINGVTLLDILLGRLEAEGFTEVTLNAHHHAPKLLGHVEQLRRHSPLRLHVSLEPDLLDTGGGLLGARRWLEGDEPFLVHNVDVLTDLPLGRLVTEHGSHPALATLVVKERPSSRQLLFDDDLRLQGARSADGDRWVLQEPPLFTNPLAFCGIHVVSPVFFQACRRQGRFGIIDAYLDLVRDGHTVRGWRADGHAWKDVGRPEHLSPL